MRIANSNIAAGMSPVPSPVPSRSQAQSPYGAQLAKDLVSPSQLFELAATRFEAALATSRIGGRRTSPSAIVAVMAMQQADSGIRNLRSISLPGTPFAVRMRAARAMDHARQGIDLLRQYHAAVAGRGDRAHSNDTLAIETIALVSEGRRQLRTAIAIARNA